MSASRWRHNAADSGGGVLTDMLHIVYLAHWIMGGPPTSVSATIDRRLDEDGDVEDIALVRYTYPTGYAFVNMAWGKGPGGLDIGGTRGRIVMETEDDGTHPFVPATRLRSSPCTRRSTKPQWRQWPTVAVSVLSSSAITSALRAGGIGSTTYFRIAFNPFPSHG